MLLITAILVAALIVVAVMWAVSYMPSNVLITISYTNAPTQYECVQKKSETLYQGTGANPFQIKLETAGDLFFWDVLNANAYYASSFDTAPFSPVDLTYTLYEQVPNLASVTVQNSGCKV